MVRHNIDIAKRIREKIKCHYSTVEGNSSLLRKNLTQLWNCQNLTGTSTLHQHVDKKKEGKRINEPHSKKSIKTHRLPPHTDLNYCIVLWYTTAWVKIWLYTCLSQTNKCKPNSMSSRVCGSVHFLMDCEHRLNQLLNRPYLIYLQTHDNDKE